MKTNPQPDWTQLLRTFSRPQVVPEATDAENAGLLAEQQERVARSKLDRLADELRAMGIDF